MATNRSERQQGIALLIADVVSKNGVDYAHDDIVAVHAFTIGFDIIDALAALGLAITRKRGGMENTEPRRLTDEYGTDLGEIIETQHFEDFDGTTLYHVWVRRPAGES